MPAANQACRHGFFVGFNAPHNNPIRSGKARGADDRFGVPAYEGVGPLRLAARAEVAVRLAVSAVMVFRVLSEPSLRYLRAVGRATSGRTGVGLLAQIQHDASSGLSSGAGSSIPQSEREWVSSRANG
jgi:hypothetical protein